MANPRLGHNGGSPLLSDTDLGSLRRGLLFVALAWAPVLLLAFLQGFALNENHERALLFDFSVYSFIIALVAFVLMEQSSDRQLAWLVGQFTAFGLVPETSREGFAPARRAMERRTASAWVEGAILVAAHVLAYTWIARNAARMDGGTWAGQMHGAVLAPTLGGWWALLGIIVFLSIAFVLPLLAFSPVLKALKREGLSRYGALASRHNLAFEAKWVGAKAGGSGEGPLGSPDVSSLADLAAGYDLVKNMSTMPVSKASVVPLVLAALAPIACVALTEAPFKQILDQLKGLLLI